MSVSIAKYIFRAALSEDINAPYIWVSSMDCESRDIVKLTNKEARKSIWCEVIEAGDNFIERYNRSKRTINVSKDQSFIIANEWYREKLGFVKNEPGSVQINAYSWLPLFIKQLFASYKHPDNTVRIAVDLALVSVILGGVGLFLGILSLCK